MKRDRDTALYLISVAAELAGVHPQTLRIYERKGLLDPARTPGGARRYSDADLERLRRIGELTDAGVSLEGVRRILELERQLSTTRTELERTRTRLAEAERRGRSAGRPELVPYRAQPHPWPVPFHPPAAGPTPTVRSLRNDAMRQGG